MAKHPKRARRLGAHIVFIDESGLLLSPLVRRSLAPKGETPVLEHQGRHRDKVSVIAALTVSPKRRRRALYFSTLIKDHFESEATAWFLRRLLRSLRGPVIVVWDRGGNHRGPAIRELLAKNPRLTLEELPTYAPELNPVEQVWNFLKWTELCNFAPNDVVHLEQTAFDKLKSIRYDKERIQTFWDCSELPKSRAMAA